MKSNSWLFIQHDLLSNLLHTVTDIYYFSDKLYIFFIVRVPLIPNANQIRLRYILPLYDLFWRSYRAKMPWKERYMTPTMSIVAKIFILYYPKNKNNSLWYFLCNLHANILQKRPNKGIFSKKTHILSIFPQNVA